MPDLGKIPDNFDPIALVEKAIESDLDVSVFDQVVDTDVRWPKNWIEWVRGHSFLNIDPFPRQIELCTNFLGEFCPHCTNPKYLTSHERFGHKQLTIEVDEPLPEILDNVVFLVEGICPKCRARRNEMLKSGDIQHFTNMNGCAGMRSSKTVMGGGLLATYQLVRFLRLPSPSSYFGLMDNQMLHCTFVALTAGQAYDTLWQAFYDRIDNSPWFREYHAFLTSEGQRLSKDLFDLKDTFLWYGHKRIAASFCGPDIRTIRGRTRIFTGMDEKGWFDVQSESTTMSSKVRMNAQETHEALVKSLQTIRSASLKLRETENENAPDGLNVDVSSPSSLNDAIMVGLREANKKPSTFAWHYATWEVNPNITLDSLKDEMVNQVIFDRDYGGIPPLGANQFISDTRAVEKLQNGENQKQYISWVRRYNTDEFGDKTMYLEVQPVVTEKRRPRILTVDTGFSNNSFAVELWSYDVQLKKPVCDLALECMPEENEGERVTINFPLMFEYTIIPLVKAFNVIMAGYDRWNSIDQVQRLRKDFGVEALQLSLKKADFDMVRSNLLDGMSWLPQGEVDLDTVRRSDKQFMEMVKDIPVTHLLLQILTVREAGRKVIKPINGTDDLWRCLCLALAIILDPKHTRKFERYGYVGRSRGGVLGTVRGSREFRNNDVPMSSRPQAPTVTAARIPFIPSIK